MAIAAHASTSGSRIPEGWAVRTLGEVAPLQRGVDLPSTQLVDGPYPVVYSNGVMNFHSKAIARGPGVVTGRSGTLGKVHYVEQDFWPHNTSLWVTRFNGNSPRFIYYLYQSVGFDRFASGSGVPTLNRNDAHAFRVAAPRARSEQEAIASALSDADALIESLEQLLAKKRHLKQGAVQQLLTGKTRLPGFARGRDYQQTEVGLIPADWNVEFIENLARITTGGRDTQDRVADGEYPFFVRSQVIERINSYSFDGEAVLTAGDGVGTGKVFHYINGRFDAHQRVYRISDFSEQLDGYFFYIYFSSRFYNRIMQMTAKSSVDSVRREMISRMLVALPPTREEQQAIAGVVKEMDSDIAALEAKLTKARQIRQGMMQELLTGRIRLV